jgi:two-component system OmpR family response regulator
VPHRGGETIAGSDETHEVEMRLLVVEDDPRLAEQLQRGLRADGYAVDACGACEDALWLGTENDYDAAIVDIGLPDGDGFGLCADLRSAGRWFPILMLTARSSVEDRVHGLDVGADDYVLKPFSFSELSARIRALTRRAAPARPAVASVGSLELDRARRSVRLAGRTLTLSIREFALLELLMRHADDVLTRAQITEHVWDWAWDGTSNVVDWYVMGLRRLLATDPTGPRIETVRGVGYVLRARATAETGAIS